VLVATLGLMFPGTERTVLRIMEHWWELKGGRPTKAQLAAAKDTALNSKGTPIRLGQAVMLVVWWQARLLQGLVDLE
jgi:hypothetical protein